MCNINDRQPIKNKQSICVFQESVQTALCITLSTHKSRFSEFSTQTAK